MTKAPSECANCGADIPSHAKACPECGADERTGWRETSVYDGIELPNDAWEKSEFPSENRSRDVAGLAWYWWATGAVLALVLGMAFLGLL